MDLRKYIPIIKTTDAEIKGFKHLDVGIKKDVLPLFELTRSRPVKGFPAGDIYRRMSQLEDYCDGNPFILDLTKHDDLMNDQIHSLIDDTNDFGEWRAFLNEYQHLNIIPAIHLYPDNLIAYKRCVEKLASDFEYFAFRIGTDLDASDFSSYLQELVGVIELDKRLIVVVDGEFVDEKNIRSKISSSSELLNVLSQMGVDKISVNSSSFPFSVTRYGDAFGEIPMRELEYHKLVAESSSGMASKIAYGDYAGIHPLRYSIAGGNWVPRIDVSLESEYIYTRYRRDDGGYVHAARQMVARPDFDPVDSWGKQQILNAAEGDPGGRSPSYWISVRLNQHITRFSQFYSDLFVE